METSTTIKGPGYSIPSECLQEVLDSGNNVLEKGLSAFYTPLEFATIVAKPLPEFRSVIVDLNGGTGQLAVGCSNRTTRYLLLNDIQPCKTISPTERLAFAPGSTVHENHEIKRITGDITKLGSLLPLVDWHADLFVLNPPWDVHWEKERFKWLEDSEPWLARSLLATDPRLGKHQIDSTIAMMLVALDRMSTRGEGLVIANEATLRRLVFDLDAPYRLLADKVWAHLVIEGNPMTGIKDSKWDRVAPASRGSGPTGESNSSSRNDWCPPEAGATQFRTGVLYFAKGHYDGCRCDVGPCQDMDSLRSAVSEINRLRYRRGGDVMHQYHTDMNTVHLWGGIKDEWRQRTGQARPEYNIWLGGDGEIHTYLSVFDQSNTKIDKGEATALNALNGQNPMQLVLQAAPRAALQRAVFGDLWKVDPKLPEVVKAAINSYHAVRAPLNPLTKIQCLGYLDEENAIVCAKSFGPSKVTESIRNQLLGLLTIRDKEQALAVWKELRVAPASRGDKLFHEEDVPTAEQIREYLAVNPSGTDFIVGHTYALRTQTVKVDRTAFKPNSIGEMQEFSLNGQELAIYIKDERGEERCFMEFRYMLPNCRVGDTYAKIDVEFTMHDLAEMFHIPEVPDVAVCQSEQFEKNLKHLDVIQTVIADRASAGATSFRFKKFQRLDYARFAIHNGGILAHDTGLGKSIAIYTLPLLWTPWAVEHNRIKPSARILIIAPGDLHQQLIEEGISKFGIHPTRLDSQDTYRKLTGGVRRNRSEGSALKPGFYITSYSQLAINKVIDLPDPSKPGPNGTTKEANLSRLMKFYGLTYATVQATQMYYVGTETEMSYEEKAKALLTSMHGQYSENVGVVDPNKRGHGIKCIVGESLADLCQDDFEVVAIDEAVRMKGAESLTGLGVRQMNARYRMVLSATPIKNRLPDIFWLAWWATGGKKEAHARFPFKGDIESQGKFSQEFMVCERNLTMERVANGGRLSRKRRGRGKVTAEVCNIHRLWKLLAPIILRRRKTEIEEEIVLKIRQPIRCWMGTKQKAVYSYHLQAPYVDKNGCPAVGAKLQALRSVAAAPHSGLLVAKRDESEVDPLQTYRSDRDYVPKLAACLTVIEQCLNEGEQVLVGSALHEPLDTLSRRLDQAGIPHDKLDGRDTQAYRGVLSADFRRGLPHAKPVLLCGVNAMAEGHNWPLASNVVLLAFDWAYNIFEQFINRAHRMTSPKRVRVWPIITSGTIDRRLESLIKEKGDASELVLDGRLIEEATSEVNLAELLKVAIQEFKKDDEDPTMDEDELEDEWPDLRERLSLAWSNLKNKRTERPARSASRLQLIPTFQISDLVTMVTAAPIRALLQPRRRALAAFA